MRFSLIFALFAFAGVASATPAAAETALTKTIAVGVSPILEPTSGTTTEQYRDRRWRGDRGWRGSRGWRGDRGWHRGYYRRSYYRPYRSWNRGRVVCRYRYGYRRCFRVY